MKKVLLVALAVLLALSFTASAFAEELPDASDLTVAGIIHTEDQFGQMIAAGMQAACDDTGAYMYRGCSNLDASKEFELVNTYASMDIDAICASPASQEGSNAVFQQLANQGITVVYVNSAQELGEATAFLSAQFSSNNEALAATAADYAAEWLAENMPGEKIVVGTMSVKEGSTPIEQRYEGFVNAIAGAGLEYEVAARGYGYTQDVALQVVGDMLTANPDINVVWCDCEGSAIGAVMAVKAAGLQDQVKVFCIDVSEQICDLLMEENPVLLAAAGQDGYAMGYDGMMYALRVALGIEEKATEDGYIAPRLFTAENPEEVAEYKAWLQELAG